MKNKKKKEDKEAIKVFYEQSTDELCISIEDFLYANKFEFIIGKKFEELVERNIELLESTTSLNHKDICDLFYPNAIQCIADRSIQHDEIKRRISRKQLIENLESTKKVAVTRWTKELKTYNQLLKVRRNQLKANLSLNHRLRYFVLDDSNIKDFNANIVLFIKEYLSKYHYKLKLHDKTPLFCINTNDDSSIGDIRSRLYKKGVTSCDGYEGSSFFRKSFLRNPEVNISTSKKEFYIRLCAKNSETIAIINDNKCDDLFVIGNNRLACEFNTQDVNLEHLDIDSINELKYLLLLTNTVELDD